MTITLNVPQLTEKRLQEAAQLAGLPVTDYVLQIIDQRLTGQDNWLQSLESGHFSAGVSLPDEATRRETIYDSEY